MPAGRITDLFHLLQCSNTDIARFAGCSPSNISRMKSGLIEPARESRSILRLAEGVYRYADHENMTEVLKKLTGKEDADAETLVPAIIGWLYETENYELPESITPRSRLEKEKQRRVFGRRLESVMRGLSFSNRRLAEEL
ncbi:MAG: hypothetical protein K6E30_08260, partial [Lachnospiraceae bacterium]|nr:hypothetical protein [Lachnospiraceae bacterium]